MSTKSTFIMLGARYAVASYNNGWAYTVMDRVTDESVFLQDDDATIFRDRLESMERAFPYKPMDWVIQHTIEG